MKRHHIQLHFLLCITCAVLSGCASKRDVKQPDKPLAQVEETAPVEQPAVEDIRVQAEQDRCMLQISTTNPPTYTIFKLSDPDRIIIDLPEMLPGNMPPVVQVNNDWISAIKNTLVQNGDKSFLRIEIGLTGDAAYNAKSEDNIITLNIESAPVSAGQPVVESPVAHQPETVPAPTCAVPSTDAAPQVMDILMSETDGGFTVTVVADTAFEKYRSCSLEKPNRLAIDLPGARCLLKNPVFDIKSALVSKIRVGQDRDKVRVVVDFAGKQFPLYQIAQQSSSLIISIEAPKAEVASVDTAMPPAAAEPARENAKLPSDQLPEEQEAAAAQRYTGAKISLDFKDADIKNVLRLISDISGLNMIVSDSVQGKVTLKLEDIPWDEALDIILETNNAGKIVTKNVTRIETRDQIKRINDEKLLAKKSQEQIEELVVKTLDISYAKASDMASFIKKMKVLSPRGSVTDFTLTNKITIQDIPENVDKIAELVKEQDVPTRQVMIEAKIVQSNPSYVKELGIRWGGTYTTTNNDDIVNLSGAAGNNYVVNLPAAAGEGSGGAINFGYIKDNLTLDLQLTALENEDKIKIISNPKILGLDNKEARIKQGVALPYLKLSEEGVTSTEFKDAVLELEVTPKITPANTITLHIFVTKNQKSSQTGAGNEPGIDVREVETDLLVNSGETVVIGGIYETQTTFNLKKVPFFGDMPYLGRFFRNEREEELLTELLVFINVTVVDWPQSVARGSIDQNG